MTDEPTQADLEHADALARTGFWGEQAAGAIVMARTTGRILLAHRSQMVREPHTWGSWGGAIDPRENPVDAVHRELKEETGYSGAILATLPLCVFRKIDFTYRNFLIITADEFNPVLNWESQDARWCIVGSWPDPLHFGLEHLFADEGSMSAILREMTKP
jgi:8-oxo-dGTP pyrophosphatase MutT (NUDIX family)